MAIYVEKMADFAQKVPDLRVKSLRFVTLCLLVSLHLNH